MTDLPDEPRELISRSFEDELSLLDQDGDIIVTA